MAGVLIDGTASALRLRRHVAEEVKAFKARTGRVPGLATVLVGDDPASRAYTQSKARKIEEAGMAFFEHKLPAGATQVTLLALIRCLNDNSEVHGIIVQLPLPKGIDVAAVTQAVAPEKDIDGLHAFNAGRLALGLPGLVPCTPMGVLILLKEQVGSLGGRDALVVGRSSLFGKPMAQLLLRENATVTIAHSKTHDLPTLCRRAEMLVVGIGQPQMVRGDWIRPGATIIDVGINHVKKADGGTVLVGDVHFEEARAVAGAITPVPGGVGPMTIACLLANTLCAASLQAGLGDPFRLPREAL